jgi:hypothetical protein
LRSKRQKSKKKLESVHSQALNRLFWASTDHFGWLNALLQPTHRTKLCHIVARTPLQVVAG